MDHLPPRALNINNIFLSTLLQREQPLLEYLITHVNINGVDNQGHTYLMYAAAKGDLAAVELLLKHGASVNTRNNEGLTALMYAIMVERVDVVKLLIAYGANVNTGNIDVLSPIQVAMHIKNMDIIKILLATSINLNHNTSSQPALHRAVIQDNIELVYLLLRNGANMFLLNSAGVSAFGIAICNGNVKLVELFLKFNPNLRCAVDSVGNSALHAAAYFNQREIFTMLVQAGADVHLLNGDDLTSIQYLLTNSIKIGKNCAKHCRAV